MVDNNFTILAGSNQGSSNLTLKGWPLTVSLFQCDLCIASFFIIARLLHLSFS